jgi:hypothetical protein
MIHVPLTATLQLEMIVGRPDGRPFFGFFTHSRETVGASLLAMDCRSRLAGDGLQCAAFIQPTRVIVNDHRPQAGSYKGPRPDRNDVNAKL